MPKFVVRYAIQLTALNQTFPLPVPLHAEDVALRVLCRYEPEDVPPPPTIVLITVKDTPDPVPAPSVTRNFMLLADGDPLPDDFAKYIGAVPFGPEKQVVNIVERLATNPT